MNMNRAPRGIPTGGQFVASSRSEPTVTLAGAAADPLSHLTTDRGGTIRDRRTGEAIPDGVLTDEDKANVFDPWEAGGVRRAMQRQAEPQARNIGFLAGGKQIMDWDTNSPVEFDSLSDDERIKVRKIAKDMGFPTPRTRNGLRQTADSIAEEFGETVEAVGGMASHLADVHRGDVPAPETEGSFVGWNQMLPKFLRRKNQS